MSSSALASAPADQPRLLPCSHVPCVRSGVPILGRSALANKRCRQAAACLLTAAPAATSPCLCSGVPILGMSALTGKGAGKLLPAALSMYGRWNQRVPTSKLNRWIEQVGGVGWAPWQTGASLGDSVGARLLLRCMQPKPTRLVRNDCVIVIALDHAVYRKRQSTRLAAAMS